jgi:hypothetical protein
MKELFAGIGLIVFNVLLTLIVTPLYVFIAKDVLDLYHVPWRLIFTDETFFGILVIWALLKVKRPDKKSSEEDEEFSDAVKEWSRLILLYLIFWGLAHFLHFAWF